MTATSLSLTSCLYFGRVMHARLQPVYHQFRYRVFSMLIDVDEAALLSGRCRLFSHNRWNALSFHDRDHGPRDGSALRPWIESILTSANIDIAGGPVRILCFPRIFGYVFNPLSIWFCHHRDGDLRAILYEVSNTFGERHCYLIPIDWRHWPDGLVDQQCDKAFHVSPFIEMEATYRFRLREPAERLAVRIDQVGMDGPVLVATQSGSRRSFDNKTILSALIRYPLMTLKVIGAIHWEALKLWRKGARLHRKPTPPRNSVTFVVPELMKAAE